LISFANLIIPIDPIILIIKNNFRIRWNLLNQIYISSNNNNNKRDNIPLFLLGKIGLNNRDNNNNKKGDNIDLYPESPRLVAIIDSFEARNPLFIAFDKE
jgi:hypothetical protein